MGIRSKTFLIRKGEPVDELSSFLQSKVGLDAYLVRSISTVPLNDTVTQLTLFYQEEPDFVIDSFAPRPGAILYSGLVHPQFDSRILFNSAIDSTSIVSGTFLVDSEALDVSRVSIDTGNNGYYIKLHLTGSQFWTEGYHEIRVDTSSLRKRDGTYFDYSPVGGYAIHDLSTSHLGDRLDPYTSRRRGVLKADVLRTSKGNSPQQIISEYLSQRGIAKERLVTYSFVSRNDNQVEIFFVYLNRLEPQIIEGFPLTNTFIPDSAPAYATLVFSTELDSAQISSTNGLFYVESGFGDPVAVSASDVILLDDLRTVRISLNNYMTSRRVYSILVKPGLRARDGTVKVKPEQWVLYVTAYEANITVSGDLNITGATSDANYLLHTSSESSLPNSKVLNGYQGITISIGASTASVGINGSFYTGLSGHTGDISIHYPQSSISITSSQVSDVGPVVTGLTNALMLSHTGNSSIHFTQADIVFPATLSGISITGSSTTLQGNVSFSGMGSVTLIQDTENNRIIFSGEPPGSSLGGAGTGEAYITWEPVAGLSNERVLSSALGVNITVGSTNVQIAMSGELYTGLTGHLTDNTLHFTQGDISIPSNQITNFGSTVTGLVDAQMLSHTGSSTIHFTQAQIAISSSQVTDIGSTVSGLIEPHTGNTNIHFTQSEINHGSLLFLTGDHHTQYVLDNGSRPFTGAVSMFASVTNAAHLAHKSYVDTQDTALIITAASLFQPINTAVTGVGVHLSSAKATYRPSVAFSGLGSVQLYTGVNGLVYISGSEVAGSVSQLGDLTDVNLDPGGGGGSPPSGSIISYNPNTSNWEAGGISTISGYSPPQMVINFHSNAGANLTLTNQAAGLQFLGNSNRNITKLDLTNYSQVRLIARVVTRSASVNSPRVMVKYHTSFSTTATDYSMFNSSEDVAIALGSATLADSGWSTMPSAARADVFVAMFQSGGDGAADPAFGNVCVQFK